MPGFGAITYYGLLIIRFECFSYLIGLVHEVKDKGVFLPLMRAVKAGESLHCLDAREALIHIHRMKERLIEACLVLLSDKQHLIFVRGKLLREFLFFNPFVHPDFAILYIWSIRVNHRAGEGYQRLDAGVAFLVNIFIKSLLVPHSMEGARCYKPV